MANDRQDNKERAAAQIELSRKRIDTLDDALAQVLGQSCMKEHTSNKYLGRVGALIHDVSNRIEQMDLSVYQQSIVMSYLLVRATYILDIVDAKKTLGLEAHQPDREQQIRDRLTADGVDETVINMIMDFVHDMRQGQLLDPTEYEPCEYNGISM